MPTHEHTDNHNAATSGDPLLRTPQAAQYLQMSGGFLAKARRFGRGPRFVRIGTKSVRYRVSALEQFLAEQLAREAER